MDWQPIINLGVAGAFAVIGWVSRTFYTDLRALGDALAHHRVEVARDYATNDDLRDINSKLDELLRYVRK